MSDDRVGWAASLDDLQRTRERLSAHLGPGREADLAIKMFGAVMGAYLTHLWAEPDHPQFFPSVGYFQMYGTPNPDTIYRTAPIDGTGHYLVSGYRGSVPDVTIMPFGPPGAGGVRTFPPFDLDHLSTSEDGAFAVELSADPRGSDRDWWRLEPETRSLMLRSVSERWGADVEPRLAITRLDKPPRRQRTDAEALRAKLASLAAVVEGMVRSGLTRAEDIRAAGKNTLAIADYANAGARPDQWYHEGWFDLEDGAGLLVEADISGGVHTFSLALTDPYFSTLDWANAQSSLNSAQAGPDSDGRLRALIAPVDTGVSNWLDTTGHSAGVLQCRWTGGSAAPEVHVETVRLDELPESMPRVTPDERANVIRNRQIGVQLRARW